MRIRASILTTALVIAASPVVGCTHAGGKLMVDAPKMLPYQAPDIDDITGIDSSDTPDEAATPPAANPAQKPHK
jgi:hypothetical protein